ncbi:MAG: hypothetical protein WCR06_00050 [bacterium]
MSSKLCRIIPVYLSLLSLAALGDQVTMLASRPKECTFQGVTGGSILFLNEKGRLTKELPSRISKISLTKPAPVTYLTADGKKEETAVLRGFEKREYLLEKDGKEIRVAAMKMKSLDLFVAAEGGNGGGVGTGYPIPKIDVDAILAATPNPTEAQKKTLARFIAARKAFDAFLAESSALVEKMDKAAGVQRENLMNTLRLRKSKEQPLKSELQDACSALTEAFPEPARGDAPDAQAQPGEGEEHPEREKIKKAVMEW